jgi:hypothetical protein
MHRRLSLILAFAILAATASAAAAHNSTLTVVHRGQLVRLNATTTGRPQCSVSVLYSDSEVQFSGAKYPVLGKVSWVIRIPNNAALGVARWTIHCGVTWQKSGAWHVAKAQTAVPTLPVVLVTNNGYSQRNDKFGTGSKVSFGIMLKNTSLKRDAQNVFLLVNFVDASGQLLGSMSRTVALVAAGQAYAYGDEMPLRTQLAVAKLEITIRVGQGAAAVAHPLPHFTGVRIVPDQNDPDFVGEVDGEIANDTSPQLMTSAQLSVVVFGSDGSIVGGGNAYVSSLPSGSRMVFLAQQGFSDIPVTKASSVLISAIPQYQAD